MSRSIMITDLHRFNADIDILAAGLNRTSKRDQTYAHTRGPIP
jgi:hypothetical protein